MFNSNFKAFSNMLRVPKTVSLKSILGLEQKGLMITVFGKYFAVLFTWRKQLSSSSI